MFRAIWEFALSADSAARSGNSQTAQHFLGMPRKRSAFWESSECAAISGALQMVHHFSKLDVGTRLVLLVTNSSPDLPSECEALNAFIVSVGRLINIRAIVNLVRPLIN